MAYQQKQQQQQSVSHGEVIRCYWTPERIQCAVPKERYRVSGKKQAIGLPNVPPTEVLDATRKDKNPYRSVGKLMFTQEVDKKIIPFHGTAYVAATGKGDNIVFTAAHNLIDGDGPSENILFIPACQDGGKEVPAYGSFAGASCVVCSKWVKPYHNMNCYDIGAVKLTKNKDGKEVGKVVPELILSVDEKYKKDETEWRIIGYVQNKMYESDGTFIDIETQQGGKLVVRTNPVIKGMSGGPWMLKSGGGDFTTANGDQSAISADDTVSPYYSKALVDDIKAQL